jgi:transcription elongation factor GreA
LTAEGAVALKQELEALKNRDRPAIIQAIAEARSHGDLSENAEYHAAKEKQGFIESRILKIEHILSLAQVIDPKALPKTEHVIFGLHVKLKDLDTKEIIEYQIVGEIEANIKKGLLSVTSPLGRSLIGKTVGETVEVKTPKGERFYEVMKLFS